MVNLRDQVDLTARFSCVRLFLFVDIVDIATSQKRLFRKCEMSRYLEFGEVCSFTDRGIFVQYAIPFRISVPKIIAACTEID